MEGLELIAFEIISSVGTARSCYIEAINEAKKGNYEKAEELIAEGEKYLLKVMINTMNYCKKKHLVKVM